MRQGQHFATDTPPEPLTTELADVPEADVDQDNSVARSIVQIIVRLVVFFALTAAALAMMANVNGWNTGKTHQTTFPNNVIKSYLTDAEELTEATMTEPASKSGLYGHVYSFTGKVTKSAKSGGDNYVVVTTDLGDVAIFDTMGKAFRTDEGKGALADTPYADYNFETLPRKNSDGTFIATYLDFSEELQLPTFQYGAHPLFDEATCINGHSFESWNVITAATCTTAGLQEATCTRCSYNTTETVPALGHTVPEYETLVEATCSAVGTAHGICSICGQDVEFNLDKTPHTPSGAWVAVSAGSKIGTRVQYCVVCGQEAARENFTLTMGQANAVAQAHSYLSHMPFSYQGLIEQLEYEGYSYDDASFAVSVCGADWNEQALLNAKSYLSHSHFSWQGLIEQLEYEGYTTDQATYAANNCGADWNVQAAGCAQDYLNVMPMSSSGLLEQLMYEGFTYDEAAYGVAAVGY